MGNPIFYAVEKGATPAVCKASACRKPIYWIKTGNGKSMPIDCDVVGGKVPTKMMPGQGVPHFGTCVAAATFSKKEK